jgi:Cu(I)/Ag(I) efflux system membrane protein CusA/SilA
LVGKYYSEERHPISRCLHRLYERPCRFVVRHAKATVVASLLVVGDAFPSTSSSAPSSCRRCAKASLLYMPSAVQPGMSVTEAQKALQVQDKILMTFPEVERVFGKAGRAGTSTDPAPLSMMETTILLKPESEWREKAALVFALGAGVAQAHPAPPGAIASPKMS